MVKKYVNIRTLFFLFNVADEVRFVAGAHKNGGSIDKLLGNVNLYLVFLEDAGVIEYRHTFVGDDNLYRLVCIVANLVQENCFLPYRQEPQQFLYW